MRILYFRNGIRRSNSLSSINNQICSIGVYEIEDKEGTEFVYKTVIDVYNTFSDEYPSDSTVRYSNDREKVIEDAVDFYRGKT
ncbi:MAG: hypothetical protein ABFD15_02205 [Methanofastidiosum sp.]